MIERMLDEEGAVSAVFLRQTEHQATFRATVETVPEGASAGITTDAAPEHHDDLVVCDGRAVLRRRAAYLITEHSVALHADGPAELAVECDRDRYRFTVRTQSETVTTGAGSARLLDANWIPGFVSVRVGVYATGSGGDSVTFANVGGEHVG